MPTSLYNFQYVPLTGRLPGKSFVSQTEQAINGLAQYVYENSTNYEAVKAIAQKAEEDSSSALEYSEEALDKAQTALETVGRAYIKTTSAVDLNDYYDSELLLILSTASTNLPASISGYLTVMSSDTHDYCMQVYIGIDGSVYKRTAIISDNTPTFGAWSETPITLSSLQTILANYTTVDASNIGVNAQTDNSTAWGNAVGGGEIANGEQRLITGGTIYPLSQNVEQNTTNIATNTADIVQNTGGISANSKRIGNIEKLLQGNLYDYQTDSTSAYTKSVPAGAMPYAGLEKLGGKTAKFTNLIKNGDFSNSYAGWAKSGSADYSFTNNIMTCICPGNAIGEGAHTNTGADFHLVQGHKYYATAECRVTTENLNVSINVFGSRPGALDGGTPTTVGNDWVRVGRIATAGTYTSNSDYVVLIGTAEATACQYQIRNVMLIDLTETYGAGNEPTSAQLFDELIDTFFINKLVNSAVTSVVSTSKNLLDQAPFLNAVSYHAEYDGYWGESTYWMTQKYPYNNYANNASPVFIQPTFTLSFEAKGVGSNFNFGVSLINSSNTQVAGQTISVTNEWQKYSFTVTNNTDSIKIAFGYYANTTILISNMQVEANSVATEYSPYGTIATYPIPAEIQSLTGYGWSCPDHYNYIDYEAKKFVQEVGSRAYASGDESDSAVITDGTNTYYALSPAVETDISQYITDDNLIEVEANGTLTFPNQNGADYCIPVPSEETYMIDLQEAINNG